MTGTDVTALDEVSYHRLQGCQIDVNAEIAPTHLHTHTYTHSNTHTAHIHTQRSCGMRGWMMVYDVIIIFSAFRHVLCFHTVASKREDYIYYTYCHA